MEGSCNDEASEPKKLHTPATKDCERPYHPTVHPKKYSDN